MSYANNPCHHHERTDPFWVHNNAARREPSHDHLRFGKSVTRRRRALDEDGNPAFTPVTKTVTIREAMLDPVPTAVYRQARRLRTTGASLEDSITFDTGIKRKRYEIVTIGTYADYCTVGMPMTREGTLPGQPDIFLPCVTHPSNVGDKKVYPRHRSDRLWAMPPARSIDRARVRGIARQYNAGAELEDV